MISYIRGEVIDRNESSVIIDVGGIGYEVYVPYRLLCTLERNMGTVELYTYLQVSEDRFTLYGFSNKQELKAFKQLISVNGIGPKGALSILSAMTIEDLMLAVISDDPKTIAKTPGIGPKTAAKLVLELKDKFSLEDTLHAGSDVVLPRDVAPVGISDSSMREETVQALVALGYTASEALKAVRMVEMTEDMTVEKLLKLSLKFI